MLSVIILVFVAVRCFGNVKECRNFVRVAMGFSRRVFWI